MRTISAASVLLSKLRGCYICSKSLSLRVSHCQSFPLPRGKRLLDFPAINLPYSAPRQFSSASNGKIFREVENEYAHRVMEKSNSYLQTVLKFPLSIDSGFIFTKKPATVVDSFAKLTAQEAGASSIENPKYASLIQQICSFLPTASDYQIQALLHCLTLWPPSPKSYSPNFKALWNSLDDECTKRCRSWDVSYRLLIADYWFGLRLNRITRYNKELICSLLENCDSLSGQQLVQLMFYVNLQRDLPVRFLPNLERKINDVIPNISIEELGVICLAYFKTESRISRAELIESIVKHFVANIDSIPTVSVAAILKFFRKSLHLSLVDVYILALHKSVPYIKSWDIPTSVHLALLSSECNIYHPMLLANVSDKLTKEMDQARIKDCTKLSLCLTHFNHFEEEFYDKLMAELKKPVRQEELKLYPKDILYLSLYYAYVGRYDYKILPKVFQKDFMDLCSSDFPEAFHVLPELDYSIEIECKDYVGPRLESFQRKVLNSRRGNIPSKSRHQNFQTRLIADVFDSLVDIFGSDKSFAVRHVLPHVYSPDIILRMPDKSEKPLKEICQNTAPEMVLTPPEDETWIAFVICGPFSFAHRSKQVTGVTAMKMRQLQVLGYKVVFVPFYEIPQNSLDRKKYVSKLIDWCQVKGSESSCSSE